jgi:predicted RNA-binding protein with PIN domain
MLEAVMSPPSSRHGPPLPHEALLVPLLDVAADVLRDLEPGDIPAALRPLAGFDRRGLTRSAARSQLARALESEKAFRTKVVERFTERPEVQAAIEAWSVNDASKLVSDAASRDDLPLLVSALFADRPAGWEFGLGVATEAYDRRRREDDAEDDRKAVETRLATADRARKRAEEARGAMELQVNRLELELKEERRLRRAREDDVNAGQGELRKQVEQLEAALAQARGALEAEQRKAKSVAEDAERVQRRAEHATVAVREADDRIAKAEAVAARARADLDDANSRIDELELQLDELRRRGPAGESAPPRSVSQGLGPSDLRVLDQVSRVAAELARQLDGLAQRAVAASASAPADVAAVDVAPVDVAPVDVAPVDVAPVAEPAPVEDVPAAEPAVEPPPTLDFDPSPLDAAIGAAPITEGLLAELDDSDALDAIPVQVPATTRRGRRRASVPVPPGMLDDSVEAAEAMVRTPGLAIVVDGYNVTMQGWPEMSLAQQRDRLCSALNELQLRVRCQVTVVFDGADVDGGRPVRYPGLRVIFSAADEEADAVVVRQVAARPLDVPVLVASSDTWVREHSEAEGARVMASATLLKVLRR